jgi:hypothetical protein
MPAHLENENVLGDARDNFNTTTGVHNVGQCMWSLCRVWHETIHSQIKRFKIANSSFHHNLEKHQKCIHAELVLALVYIKKSGTNFFFLQVIIKFNGNENFMILQPNKI